MTPLDDIRARIKAACKTANRVAHDVSLVAVSKTQPQDKVETLLAQGQRLFGENRLQEACARWLPLRETYPDVKLHLIGHLQTNKANDAVALFDCIETVDSLRLADALKTAMDKQNRPLPCFIQVNTGAEPQKAGVAVNELAALLEHCRTQAKLDIQGLMCIPPAQDIPDLHFALLHKLAHEHGLPALSMGMSADFETAIRYGATHIRIGTALFGQRS